MKVMNWEGRTRDEVQEAIRRGQRIHARLWAEWKIENPPHRQPDTPQGRAALYIGKKQVIRKILGCPWTGSERWEQAKRLLQLRKLIP